MITNRTPVKFIVILAALFMLNGCFATATTQQAPAMTKRTGNAPTVAMLPVGNTNDQVISDFASQHMVKILQDRNVFKFADQEKVNRVVAKSGVDMSSMFGFSESEYKALAAELGVDYVLHGFIGVRKSLTFTGWRKDVDIWLKLYNGTSGKKVDAWRSMTDFAWTKLSTSADAQKMAVSAANHICAKVIESSTF